MRAPDGQAERTLVSPNVAKALSSRWRARVWAEVAMRPMSPSQFVREIGGERSHIARRFRELAEWGLIELAEERRGGGRRGGVEHVYRAVQRARIEDEAASRLPQPMREEISGNILIGYVRRIAEAVEAGTFDAEPDRQLSYDVITLDRRGWLALNAELAQILDWIPELAREAAQRMAETDEAAIPTTVGMVSFRSPRSSAIAESPGPPAPAPAAGEGGVWDDELRGMAPLLSPAMAKAVANPWRARVLAEVSLRPLSPSQFVREIGGELDQIARCFRQLKAAGFLGLVETKPARGRGPVAVEHVYRIVRRVQLPIEAWSEVPRLVSNAASAAVLAGYFERIATAFEAGTFDLDADRHLSWDVPAVDRAGWNELVGRLGELRAQIPMLEREASERIERGDGEEMLVTVGLTAFRSPSTGTGGG